MKKLKVRILVPWVALSLALLACAGGNSLTTSIASKLETGTISFVSPVDGAVFHQDVEGIPPTEPVLISSTFNTDKNVTLITQFGPTQCLVLANETTPCGNIPYLVGENTLSAETKKLDGETIVSAQTSFTWIPYTPMDKFVATVTGNKGGDPTMGYILIGFFAALIAAVVLAIKAREAGAILGFFLVLIALAAFTSLSASAVSVLVIRGVIALASGGLVLIGIVTWIKSGHSITAPRFQEATIRLPDGTVISGKDASYGHIGPGEHAQHGNTSTNMIEAARNAGLLGIPEKESYDTPLRLKE